MYYEFNRLFINKYNNIVYKPQNNIHEYKSMKLKQIVINTNIMEKYYSFCL